MDFRSTPQTGRTRAAAFGKGRTLSLVALAALIAAPAAHAAVTMADPVVYKSTIMKSPAFIASGDLNRDGRPDLAVADSSGNAVCVLINKGDGTFNPPVSYPTGTGANWVAIADLNGDGNPDLAVVNAFASPPSVSVLLSSSVPGTFLPAVSYPAGLRPYSVVAASLSGGLPDLIVTNQQPPASGQPYTVSVLRNVGAGTFGPATTYWTDDFPKAACVADFNNDGRPDVVTANFGRHSASILPSNGDGTLQPSKQADGTLVPNRNFDTTDTAYGVTATRLSGDNYLDLLAADYSKGGVLIMRGGADGTLGPATRLAGAAGAWAVGTGDFNSDGRADIAVANNTGQNVQVFTDNGDGTYAAPMGFANNVGHIGIAVADFNGDGLDDIALANTDTSVSVLLNTSIFLNTLALSGQYAAVGTAVTGTLTMSGPAPAGGAVVALASSDDGSGLGPMASVPPTVTVPAGANSVTFDVVARRAGTATITATYNGTTRSVSLNMAQGTTSGLKGDMDGDGRLTLADVEALMKAISGLGGG